MMQAFISSVCRSHDKQQAILLLMHWKPTPELRTDPEMPSMHCRWHLDICDNRHVPDVQVPAIKCNT